MYTLNHSTYVKLKNWKKIVVESEVNAMVTFGCLVPGLSAKVSSECWHYPIFWFSVHLISSVAQSCLTLFNPMDCSTPGFPVHYQLPELVQTHVRQVCDAIQPSHPLSPPSPPALNLLQHQGLFQWVSSSHQVARVLELQLQHQAFRWVFRTDFL